MKPESSHDTKLHRYRKTTVLLFLLSAIIINLLPANIPAGEKIQKTHILDKTADEILKRAEILQTFEALEDKEINEICNFTTSYGETEFIKTEYYNTPFHDDVAMTLRNMASLYMICHPPMAEKYLSAVIGIQEKLYGKESEQTAEAYDELGDYYRIHTMQFEDAISSYNAAKAIRIKVYGSDDPRITKNCFRLAVTLFYHDGRKSSTDKLILDSVRIRKNFKGKTQVKLSKTFLDAGIYYSLVDDYSTAIDYFNKALKSEEEKTVEEESEILLELGNIYLNKNDESTALKYYETSHQKIKEGSPQDNHNLFKLVVDQMISLSEDAGNKDKANRLKIELETVKRKITENL